MLNRYDELDNLADNTSENDDSTGRGNHQPRLPGENVIMLQAPRHAHQADHIERHEGDMETNEPAPECSRAPAFVEREAERLGKPIHVAGEYTEHDTG